MKMKKIKIGITHGDINGVGYEVILKTFDSEEMLSLCTPIVYGSPKVATYHRKSFECPTNFVVKESANQAEEGVLNIVNCFGEKELKIDFAKSTEEAGNASFVALEKALDEYKEGAYDVLVTAPINKNNIQREGFHFPGHTEYIEEKVGDGNKALMILMKDSLRIALVTTHLPISQVAQAITKELIEEKISILYNSLRRDFMIDNPRIAVLSLNPHCGDGGLIGSEEQEIITPVINEMFDKGIHCFGPYAADGFFGSGNYQHFDAILAMYHDQGLAPFKALAMDGGVNFTAGLPIIRTSPAHGTAYDIAGKGIANEDSFRQAVYVAIDVARNRNRYDEAYANPLQKQYYEKRDDSDKLKLDQVTEEDTF
ncbi:MAG: 4-hydroxythreonine-4-phosphate dehydrogenase PdxA [Bacteroidaceae bacterium]|nr:4-hydroxythreonine-4-phosphate dehydrogenase PdxA [Bacteroidaceae bacterium]